MTELEVLHLVLQHASFIFPAELSVTDIERVVLLRAEGQRNDYSREQFPRMAVDLWRLISIESIPSTPEPIVAEVNTQGSYVVDSLGRYFELPKLVVKFTYRVDTTATPFKHHIYRNDQEDLELSISSAEILLPAAGLSGRIVALKNEEGIQLMWIEDGDR